ncbi:MAG: aminotransferase class V-fold PLP-dependent enzyme [Acidimicrobiia bacterium]|nr:aminotransferase class V-fold PLP-dependent enzyme [Acidimicrobiia bacterium]
MFDSLDLNAEERSQLAALVSAFADNYLHELPGDPASWPQIEAGAVASLAAPPSEVGTPLDELLRKVTVALNSGINTASGKFLSYIPSGGIYSAAAGRFLGAVVNRYTGGSHGAPGLIALEQGVIRWMCDIFDLPDAASGVLFSGGSTANLTATIAARSRLGHDFGHGVLYTSERAHHSIEKSASMAGIRPDRIRSIPVDGELRLDSAALRAAIEADEAAGLSAMMIVATGGTTDTGTIDPLAECAEIAAKSGAWFHVDAAYGGFFALTLRGRARLSGIALADSITVDAHKSLFLPFGIGGLLVRNEASLMNALDGRGAYMQDVPDHAAAIPNYFAMGPELTRPARGLEAWLALHLHGVEAFRHELDRMIDLAEWSAAELERLDGITIAAQPEMSIVAFRADAGTAATKRIFEYMNHSRRVHVSSTTIGDEFFIRLAFLNQRTTTAVAADALELVRESLAEG